MRLLIGLAALAACGCATAPDKVAPQYVSPALYKGFTCEEIEREQAKNAELTLAAAQGQAQARAGDAGAVAGGAVFLPAFLLVGAHKDREAELARLKGESAAMYQTSIDKGCPGAPAG